MSFSRETLESYPSYDPHRVIVCSKNSIYPKRKFTYEISTNQALVVPSAFASMAISYRLGLRSVDSVLRVAQLLSPTMLISLERRTAMPSKRTET